MRSGEFKLIDILLPYQKKFVLAPQRKKLWVSGRQLGKSFAIAFLMCYEVLRKKNSLGLCISTGSRAASELLKKCKLMAEAIKLASHGQITFADNAESVTFSTGSRILSLPSNPDALRGFHADIVCIDEAAFVPFIDECYQAILPTLTRTPDSKLVVCSTPAGQAGLFYSLCSSADDTWHFQATTIEDAIADGLKVDIEELRKLCPDPDIWDQEYMCKFSKEFGSFIDDSLVDFVEDVPECQATYLGADIGRKHDKTAITVVKQARDELYLDNVVVLDKCEYSQQVQIIKELNEKHRFTAGYVDEGGIGSALAEQVTKTVSSRIRGLQFTGSNKTPMYESVRAKIFDHKLKIRKDFMQQVKDDFRNVSRLVTESGQVKFEAGRDGNGHSDITSSLVLAVQAAHDFPLTATKPSASPRPSAFGPRKGIFCRY